MSITEEHSTRQIMATTEDHSSLSPQERLLVAARHGDMEGIERLLSEDSEENVDCHANGTVERIVFGGLKYWQTVGGCEDFCATFHNATALHVATYFQQPDVVDFLLDDHGADMSLAVTRIDFSTNDGGDTPKWRYTGMTALHLAVACEESGRNVGDYCRCGSCFEHRRYLVFNYLVATLQACRLGISKQNLQWSNSDISEIIESKANACWYYSAMKEIWLEGATALGFAAWMCRGNPVASGLTVINNKEALLDLIFLLDASTETSFTEVWNGYDEQPGSMKGGTVQDLLPTRLAHPSHDDERDYDYGRMCQPRFRQMMKGYRSEWRKQVSRVLRGGGGDDDRLRRLDDALVVQVLEFAEMWPSDIALDVLRHVSGTEEEAYLRYSQEEEETALLKLLHASTYVLL